MKRCKTLCLLILVASSFVAEAPIVEVVAGSAFRPVDAKAEKSFVVVGSITRNIFNERRRDSSCGFEKKSNYSNIVVPLSNQYGVDWRLITAIMAAESGFNPCAISPRGAVGLMQITPDLAGEYRIHGKDMFDPAQNVRAGILHVKRLSQIYNGDLELTVAAYNAGEGNVARYGGIPPFRETQNFVKRVLSYHSDLEVASPAAGSPMALLRTR
jgi:soluble lytic murein transglycosylase-like protein